MMCGGSEAVDIICGRITFDRSLLYEQNICFFRRPSRSAFVICGHLSSSCAHVG